MWRKENAVRQCQWECKLVQQLRRTVWKLLYKLKSELPYAPAIPLLGTYLKKTITLKDTCAPTFIALFTRAKTWEQPKGPTQMNKEDVAHIYNGMLLSRKKE